MSNLTISDNEESDSLVECSQNSTFGFHLMNITSVSLTGIQIRNCGFTTYYKHSILIEASREVILSGFHIEYSPGYGITMIGSDFTGNVRPNVTVIDCSISYSRETAMLAYDTSVLIERTQITNL